MCRDDYGLKVMNIDDNGLYGSFLNNFILWACALMIVVCVVYKWHKNGSHGNGGMKFACA